MPLEHTTKERLMDANEFRSFIFSGRAKFTMVNTETKNHITYYIKSRKVKRGQDPETRFFVVDVKAIGDQISGKVEVGEIDRKKGIINVKEGIKSDYVGLVTIKWLLNHWRRLGDIINLGKLKIYHHGLCCSCGRDLEIEDSIQEGIGPVCVISKVKRSLKLMKELGVQLQEGVDFTTPVNYDVAASFAVANFPDYLDKFYIPARLRRKDEFIGQLYELDKFGLW